MKTKRGSSLIEALVLVFVFSVVSLSFYAVFSLGIRYSNDSKNRTVATAIATQRMELLRNLGYDDVATIGGIPPGNINPDEQVSVGNRSFHVLTDIYYYDDADDGTVGGSPNDSVPNDYKIGRVTVRWGEEGEKQRVQLISRFVPPGVENSAGGGTFSLNTIDFSGNPVGNVSVNLRNNHVIPNVNYNTQTDSGGNLLLQGVPADTDSNYQITLDKNNYETVRTYPFPPAGAFSPSIANFPVLEGVLNEKSMRIDLLANLEINSRDPFSEKISDASFDLLGGRRLDDGTAEPPVYTYDNSESTNTNGKFSVDNISAGEYNLAITDGSETEENYIFWKMEPGTDDNNNKFNLLPGADLKTDMILLDKELDSVFVRVNETETNSPVENASVHLENIDLNYNENITTDKYGYAYFPIDKDNPLINGESYNLTVTADGYDNETATVDVDKYTAKEITLDVSE